MDDKLGDDGEADDPEVEEDIPEIVLKSCRILEPEYKEVSSYVDTTQKQNLSVFFINQESCSRYTAFYIV